MNVMAINSSPRTQGESRSERLLLNLVEGMKQENAQVEVINLREYNIKFCRGCYTCWTKTPGKCPLKDDMSSDLFPKWLTADIVVYSSPLYYRGFTAQLQAFIERTLPSYKPFIEPNGEKSGHPPRVKFPDFVVLSAAGFPEMLEFQLLSDWCKTNFETDHSRLLAEIYRPGAQALTQSIYNEVAQDVYSACIEAGRELIKNNTVSDQTMARITQETQEKSDWIKTANLYWQSCIDEKMIPKQFEKSDRVPVAKTVDDIRVLIPGGINKTEAQEIKERIQFRFGHGEDQSFYLDIQKGKITALPGETDSAALTINTPFEVWRDIMTGKADGTQMLMEGKYQIEGDGNLLIKLFT
ncbi:NAD(P)H-dependent oxidoreductase [Desulfobacterales bacterium HSG17]|nr:NAD(P)H-dependent oxidoreductase [Desulfobacterales bacterium HSG17]